VENEERSSLREVSGATPSGIAKEAILTDMVIEKKFLYNGFL